MVLVFLNRYDIDRSIGARRMYSLAVTETGADSLARHAYPTSEGKEFVNRLPGYGWALENLHTVQLARNGYVLVSEAGLEGAWAGLTRRGAAEEVPEPGRPAAAAAQAIPHPGAQDAAVWSPKQRALAVRLGKALFARLAAWCDVRGVEFVVVTTGWLDPEAVHPSMELTDAFLETAPAFFDSLGTPFYDQNAAVSGQMRADPGRFIIEGDTHPNELGCRLIASSVWPFLEEQWAGHLANPSATAAPAP